MQVDQRRPAAGVAQAFQSWGNRFTNRGVQQLASLTSLASLYLEEETLSAAAFDIAASLPHLARLGLQDVPASRRRAGRTRATTPQRRRPLAVKPAERY